MFIKYSTCQIPPKKSTGKGSQGKKIVDVSQEIVNVSEETRSLKHYASSQGKQENHHKTLDTGGSSEGSVRIPGVLDESKGLKNKSEHSDDSKLNFDDAEKKDKDGDTDDEGDDHISNTQDTDDEDAETESDEDEIYKYKICIRKDVDVEMAKPEIVEHENKENDVMTDAAKPDVKKSAEEKGDDENAENVVGSNYQVIESTEFPLSSSSLSVSSEFGTKFFNSSSDISLIGVLKDSAEADVSSLMDIHIQQETPHIQSPSVQKVPVSVILETTNLPPIPEILIETPVATAISPPQVTPTILILRVTKLEKDVSKLKNIDHSAKTIATLKSQVPTVVDNYLRSKLGDALKKALQKHSEDLIQTHSVKPAPESSKI
ncbi:hypothetical protein Tco_0787792 [Tanacetum coccineum]